MTDRNRPSADTHAGQAIYTPAVLAVYDVWVHGLSNPWIWKCPTAELHALYATHASANHLDVGVGTGLLLDRCPLPARQPRIGLMDLNETALQATARRLQRYQPESYKRDVLRPVEIDAPAFESIGLTYVLHCLPGNMQHKSIVFEHLMPLLKPGGVLFGATLLGRGVPRSPQARALMALYNRRGIFCNRDDNPDALRAGLDNGLVDVRIERIGCAALFSARKPD